ncbi:hypothetical protein EBZ38_10590 [bacterium]|nr:hypothetical protein [bacterium]NDC94922.1 hypothetical protein [bacterium]NDD84699.1 hypothetical protein [bacterium]NDG19440.1 hypothetical protein [Betaproteobacteria bacterium]
MIVKVGNTEADIRVEAVLSMPRLSFTANHFAWAQALMPLGIRPTMGTGAFWDQVNSRIFDQFIDKCEYLLTIDYDTFFTREDVEHLFAMALTFQCDALTGLQTKREDGRPMLTLKGMLDNPPEDKVTTVPASWFAEPVQEVDSAHFGLTVISTAALKRCKKPWFWSKPAADGTWGEGRLDPDIYWWKNWRESGNRVYVTPRVILGHGEYVVTWPGKDLTSPVFQWTTEFTSKHRAPETAWSLPKS